MDKLSITILKIYLDRPSLSLHQLSAILNVDSLTLSEPVDYLRKRGYLRIESNHAATNTLIDKSSITLNTPLEITFEGKMALDAEQKLLKTKRNEWIRYIITTAIALSAFVKSFFFNP